MKHNSIDKTILLVHSGSESKYFIANVLKKMGLRVICLNREKVEALDNSVDHWILSELNDHKESIEAVKEFLKENKKIKIDGVITFWDECVLLTSKLVDTFNLIGIPYHIAEKAKNKYFFREFCNANNIPAPRHMRISGGKDIPLIEKHLSYPLVIKPVYGAVSAFVVKVKDRAELEETYEYIKNNIKSYWLAAEWETLELLVEEYIDGDEVDVDIILQNGKVKFYSIADNFNKSKDKFFVDNGQAIPSGLPEPDQEALLSLAEETVEKLGIQNGIIHFEAKSTKNGPVPIEINLRMGGDYIHAYIKDSWGVDMVEYAAKIALGEYIKIQKPEFPFRYIMGWDFQVESSGILVELDISPELKTKKYLHKMSIGKEIGDVILRPPEGYDGLGWITVYGDNLLDAQDNLKEALELIQYKVVEFDEESTLGKTSRKNSLSAAVITKDRLMQAAKIEKVHQTLIADQRNLHIGIASNISDYKLSSFHTGSQQMTENLEHELKKRGYKVTIFDFNNINKVFSELENSNVDLIFNLCQGINNNEALKPQAAAIFEALRIPYTGTNSLNLGLCRDKIRMKKLLTFHDIPTPKWDYAYTVEDTIDPDLKYPLIVKPGNALNSMGITNGSVVTNKVQLRKQIKRIIEELRRPALIEEYVEGEEFSVSILGTDDEDLRVLPLTRSVFKKMPKGKWNIYTEKEKQKLAGENKNIIVQYPLKNVSKKLESLLTEIALDTYKTMRCRDYGRVEIRLDKDDNPYVLEINTNPFLDNPAHIFKSAEVTGMKTGDLIEEIIRLSLSRFNRKKRTYYSDLISK